MDVREGRDVDQGPIEIYECYQNTIAVCGESIQTSGMVVVFIGG